MSNFKAIWGIYLRGLVILRNRWIKVVVTMFLSPSLYALTFGWGVGHNIDVDGVSYIEFIMPGLMAMAGMNQSFSIAQEMNVARFFNYFFEEYLLSPARDWVVVLGNVLYGVTKGLASFCAILIIGLLFGCKPSGGPAIIIPVVLNSFMFASLAVWISLIVKNHRDMNTFQSFVIIPMSFISGTFFSLGSLPSVFRYIVNIIPLTHSSLSIREAYLGRSIELRHLIIISLYTVFFFTMAVRRVRKAVI